MSMSHLNNLLLNNGLTAKHTSLYFYRGDKLVCKSYKNVYKSCILMCYKLNSLHTLKVAIKYVGLLIKTNYLLPSLILGCIKCGVAFVCLDPDASDGSALRLARSLPVSVICTVKSEHSRKAVTKFSRVACLLETFQLWDVTLELWQVCTAQKKGGEGAMLYAVQTSGSTGEPKTVQVPEAAIMPNISHLRKEFKITAEDVVLLASPPTFDPFMVELLLALTSGAALLVVSSEQRAHPSLLLNIAFPVSHTRPQVTVAQLTPSVFQRWTPELIRSRILTSHTSLRILALGGEKFPPAEFWSMCRDPENRTELYNLYGTTELSCWAMIGRDEALGSPLSDTLLRVECEDEHIVSGTGELFIGSETRLCLVGGEAWEQLTPPVFRATGDIVTVKDGVYNYVGRKDNMVKRWGHRVCLEAVEAVAAECEGVSAACCVLHQGLLGLYVQLRTDCSMAVVEPLLRTRLRKLNKASEPDIITPLEAFPVNRHGKVNRNKLKQMLSQVESQKSHGYTPEEKLTSLWKKFMPHERSDAGFLDSGGDSVTAMQLVNALAEQDTVVSSAVLTSLLNNGSLDQCCHLLRSKNEFQTIHKTNATGFEKKIRSRNEIERNGPVLFVQLRGDGRALMRNIGRHSTLSIAWACDMEKCVDASPTCIAFKNGKVIVVAGSHSGKVVSVELESGAVVGETRLPDRVESSLAPAACATRGLIGCYDGGVYCLSLTVESHMGAFRTGAMVKGIPTALWDGWVFGSYDYHVYCITATDQKIVWKHKMDGMVLASPVVLPGGGGVVVASLTGQVAALDAACGTLRWQRSLASPVFSSPTLGRRGLLLVAQVEGVVHALCPETGSEMWQWKAGGKIFSSLTVRGGEVLFGCHDGQVYCLSCCARVGVREQWRVHVGAPVYATPCLLTPHHALVASTAGRLCVISVSTGRVLADFWLPGSVFSSPVTYKSYIVVGCRDNNLYCLRLQK